MSTEGTTRNLKNCRRISEGGVLRDRNLSCSNHEGSKQKGRGSSISRRSEVAVSPPPVSTRVHSNPTSFLPQARDMHTFLLISLFKLTVGEFGRLCVGPALKV